MKKQEEGIANISKDMFAFVNEGERLHDKKFEDKPISYMRDAFNRFCRNKGSVTAAIIIILLLLFAFLSPLVITSHDGMFLDVFYAKKPPRMTFSLDWGFLDGGSERDFTDRGLIKAVGVGIAAEDKDGLGNVTLQQGLDSYYQPMRKIGDPVVQEAEIRGQDPKVMYHGRIDAFLEVGFVYRSVEQAEYRRIVEWQEQNGIQIIYPLVDVHNEYCRDPEDANFWYKTNKKGDAVTINEKGKAKKIAYGPDMVLEDNYKRDEDGNVLFYEHTGGGNFDTAQYKIRVLYYNYFRYINGREPNYLFGADAQGHDLLLRLAGGIRLSILLSIAVSAINLTIGAVYGAIEGYYGGATDMIMERISDVLSGMPFTILVMLFQLHLSAKVGPIPSLLLAFVATGWLGTASTVRRQFYRFKSQEYILAARTLGAKDQRIIWKHIFPNALGTIITSSVLVIPGVILTESSMSYLGIVKLSSVKTTSLGVLLSDASGQWTLYPHLLMVPTIVIALLMICFNLFGNGLRDAFNPSLRGVEE